MRYVLFALFICVTQSSFSDEGLFSVTPEQMVFASKLTDSNRKMFCHQFSMRERQKAVDLWHDEIEPYSPDEAVISILQSKAMDDDLCLADE
jgi:hypothetical protein